MLMKMFNIKRSTLSIVLGVALLSSIFLAGCSSDSNDKSGKSNEGKTTITVWSMGDEGQYLSDFAKSFEEEHTDIQVNVQVLPWDQAHDKLLTAVASKQGADVIQIGTTWMPEFAAANVLKDITPYLEKYPDLKGENFFDGAVSTTQFGDKTVGVPWNSETRVLFYRTDLLEEVGYSEAPKNWEELRDAAAKLSARGDDKYGMSDFVDELNTAGALARQNGSQLIDENNQPLFHQKEFVEALEYAAEFFHKGYTPNYDMQMTIGQTFGGEGIVPMLYSGPWTIQQIKNEAPDLEGKWATALLPEKENNNSFMGGSNLVVFEHTDKTEAALEFISYMSKPETQLKWLETTNALPANVKAWEDATLKEDPIYQVFGEQLETAEPLPLIPEWNEIDESYKNSIERIKLEKADVQKEMDSLNQKAEEILNK